MRGDVGITIAMLVFVVAVYAAIVAAMEPDCPSGARAWLTRSGWYCTVPAMKR